MSEGMCGFCRFLKPLILLAVMVLLLLVNLEVLTGSFATLVSTWWPAGIGVVALFGFCPCGKCEVK